MSSHETRGGAGIAGRTASGAAWLVAARLGARGIDFAVLMVLARLLTPADFGLVAIAVTLVQIIEAIFELPVSQVVVRSPTVTPGLLDTAFTLGLLRSALLAGLLAAGAAPFAAAYGDARLVPLILVLSLAPMLRGIVSPAMAHFARALDFRRAAALDLLSKLAALALVAAMAVADIRSYWAIVVVTVAAPAAATGLSFVLAPWRPRLSLAGWRAFTGFLGWFTLSQLASALNWKASRLVLGAVVPKVAMGGFAMASDLAALPEQALVKPVLSPLMAAFAQVQGDRERLARAYQRSIGALATVAWPLLIALALLAEPVVRLALGAKWQAIPPIVAGLAWAACFSALAGAFNALCVATGRTADMFRSNLAQLAIGLPLVLALALAGGVPGAVVATMLWSIANAAVMALLVRRICGIGPARQFLPLWRPAVAGLAEAVAITALAPVTAGKAGIALALALAGTGLAGVAAFAGGLLAAWIGAGRPEGIEASAIAAVRRFLPWRGRRASA